MIYINPPSKIKEAVVKDTMVTVGCFNLKVISFLC